VGSVFIIYLDCCIGSVVVAAMLLNAPPVLAGFFAGKKFPDDVNVVSLWKVLVGIPAFLIWILFACALCVGIGKAIWFLGYVIVTWLGLHLYYGSKN